MNLFYPFGIKTLWSHKKELFYVILTFLLALLLLIIVVITASNSGIQEVSDKLAKYDAKTNTVRLYYPDGTFYKELSVNITWPVNGVVTSEFGTTHLPYYLYHSGIDIANPEGKKGNPVTPFMPGKVVYEGQIFWGFGKHIILDHGENITSIYAHLDKINVRIDQEVKPGDVIGLEGSTGWSTGTHLHFQINVFGIPINPRVFLGN